MTGVVCTERATRYWSDYSALSASMLVRQYTPADREACLRIFESNVPTFFASSEQADYREFLDELPGPYLVVVGRMARSWPVAGTP